MTQQLEELEDYRIWSIKFGIDPRTTLKLIERNELQGRRVGRRIFIVTNAPLPEYRRKKQQRSLDKMAQLSPATA
jgi:hypothetical protein